MQLREGCFQACFSGVREALQRRCGGVGALCKAKWERRGA